MAQSIQTEFRLVDIKNKMFLALITVKNGHPQFRLLINLFLLFI